ncbi:MAG: TolC family protein [Bacteroidota bacterium]
MRKPYLLLVFIFVVLSLSAQKETYSIGMLLDSQTEEIAPILEQLRVQITTVVGEDATIVFEDKNVLVNNFDLETARSHYNQLVAGSTDIILAFGVVNSVVITEQANFPKPTILFGAVNRDLVPIDIDQTTSGIDNFTFLIESKSFQQDINKLKELTDFDSLGVIIEQQVVDILPVTDIFDRQLEAVGANYRFLPFTTVGDIVSNLEGIDAVYLAGGFLLTPTEIQRLADTFINQKLPAFTSTGIEDVLRGLLATNQGANDFAQIQRRIALNVEAYINGAALSEMPIFIDYTPRLTINFNTAELVGVPIKYSLIGTTDFVGDPKNALSEREYNLLSAINQVIDQNLTLSAGKKDIELANQDVTIAKSDYLPNVEAALTGTYVSPDLAEVSFGQNPEFSTGGSITAKQLVFSQAANANIAIQRELLKAQEQNFNTTQLDLIFDVGSVYLATLIAKANTQIQIQNLDLTKKNLEIATQNFEVGSAGKSDILRFRSQLAQNTQSMVEAINQLEQNFVVLNQLLNNPVDLEIDVEDVAIDEGLFERYNYDELTNFLDDPQLREPFINFLAAEALNNSPELKSLDYNLGATALSIDLFGKGRYYPTVALQGQYNRVFNRNGAGADSQIMIPDGNYNVGVNVSLPLFNQNLNNLNEQSAIIQREQLNLNRANTELALTANVRTNVLNLVNQISNITLSEISETTAQEALELTQTAYSSGSVNLIQLIDAQNNYLNAQLARASAVYNFMINALQLERSIGYFFLLNSEADNTNFRQRFLTYLQENGN